MNENWRAKCDGPGHVLIRLHGLGGSEHGFDVASAKLLRDELTKAIEEAERWDDPFEQWLAKLPQEGGAYLVPGSGPWLRRGTLRSIWDAMNQSTK